MGSPVRRPLLALAAVLALIVGGSLVATAATPDPCDATYKGNTIAYLKAYDACRFNRLDAKLAQLGATATPSATATATATPTVTASATPSPTSSVTPSPSVTPTSASPTPTVTPTGTPTAGAKPGPSNTGVPAGTVLTAYSGPSTITADGTVIDGKDVTGNLVISAKNVIIRNSKVHGTSGTCVAVNAPDHVDLVDSEIYGCEVGITYDSWTGLRLNLHDTTFDGIKMSSNASLRDSWIHSPKPTADAHWDGIQVQNGVINTLIQGNNIDVSGADANSALFLCPDLGPTTPGPLTVDHNWLDGGNYTVYILDGANGAYFIRDIRVTGNRFGGTHQYGYSDLNVPITQSGNTDSAGAPLAL